MSWELVPPVAVDKGTTVIALAEGYDAVCFIGDDRGDSTGLRRPRSASLTAVPMPSRSWWRAGKCPAELLREADLAVDGPAGVLELLELLAGA